MRLYYSWSMYIYGYRYAIFIFDLPESMSELYCVHKSGCWERKFHNLYPITKYGDVLWRYQTHINTTIPANDGVLFVFLYWKLGKWRWRKLLWNKQTLITELINYSASLSFWQTKHRCVHLCRIVGIYSCMNSILICRYILSPEFIK